MAITVQCACGNLVRVVNDADLATARCPACGLFLPVLAPAEPFVRPAPPDDGGSIHLAPVEVSSATAEPGDAAGRPRGPTPGQPKPNRLALGPMLQALLAPRAIHAMLTLGGGLCVLGLIVWLASLGIFERKLVLSATLAAGTLLLLGSGWFVALRTKYRLAGQALTFLACVVAPLNLWFDHAQGLVTVDHGLWVGGVVCSLLYVATVYALADPLFMYAVEVGLTLTVVLFLGQFGLAGNTSYLCLSLMGLGLVSIHAERAFPAEEPVFSRRRFGMPLFWSGHAQAGAALMLLLATQLANWLLQPAQTLVAEPWLNHALAQVTQWSGGLLPQSYLLATGLWLAGVYLYLYSDLVVRRVGVYGYFAAFSLLMAEVTLVGRNLDTEAFIAVLALTALAVNLSTSLLGRANEKLRRALPRLALALSALPVLMGIALHLRATSQLAAQWQWAYQTGWPFVEALLVVAIANRASAFVCRRTDSRSSAVYFFFSAAALLVAGAGWLRIIGLETWTAQAPWLMAVPVAYLIAARLWRGHSPERPLYWIAHAATAAILVSLLGSSLEIVESMVQPIQHQPDNLLLALVFAEVAVFYSLAARFQHRAANVYLATAAACGALWQGMGYHGVPGAYHTMLYAALGVIFLAVSRLLGIAMTPVQQPDGEKIRLPRGRGLPAFQSGNAILFIALLAAIMQGLTWLPSLGGEETDWLHLWSLSASAAAGAIAVLLMPSPGWRRVYGTMSGALVGLSLVTLNQLVHLEAWQKLELFCTVMGALLIVASYRGRFHETGQVPDDRVTLGLWVGSLLATIPLSAAVAYHRMVEGSISLPDELGLLTISILLLLTGFVWQIKSTTLLGGTALAVYLVALVVSMGWRPQIAVGAYLAIGGGLLFASGIALSVYREKLLQIPEKIVNREGIFRVFDWR